MGSQSPELGYICILLFFVFRYYIGIQSPGLGYICTLLFFVCTLHSVILVFVFLLTPSVVIKWSNFYNHNHILTPNVVILVFLLLKKIRLFLLLKKVSLFYVAFACLYWPLSSSKVRFDHTFY